MNLKQLLCVSVGICLGSPFVRAQNSFSGEIDRLSVEKVCNAVAAWQIGHHGESTHSLLQWTNGVLYRGMVEWGETAGDMACTEFVRKIGRENLWRMNDRVYHADDLCVGQAFIELYKSYRDESMLQPVLERAYYVATHPSDAPLSKKDPKGKTERWSWCDALFMAPPVYAALYGITGEKVFVDYMDSEFRICVDSLYDREERLFYRDCLRIFLREPNGAKQFWGRGNGWVFGAIPLILENLPENHPTRFYYIGLFRQMAERILGCQDKNGAWHSSLLDPESYPLPENSASAFFCYGLAWGIRNGYLTDPTYRKALEKGWRSLVRGVQPNGKLGYIQPVGAAPTSVDADSTDVYGVGALLLAGSELYLLTSGKESSKE